MRIMVLGATGMLGHQVLKTCGERGLQVTGVARNLLPGHSIRQIDDVRNLAAMETIIREEKPDWVINGIGIVVQLPLARDYHESVSINSLLPHQLEKMGARYGFRLIQISTDCVFNGRKGMYTEQDQPDAEDLYGKTKELGEVNYGCGITIRTSLIGHEIVKPAHGLLEWFLAQDTQILGYTRAVFSGLSTPEFARVLLDFVIPSELPAGIYHLASEPISKYALLKQVAAVYRKKIRIEPSEELVVDRSLDGSLFNILTGYRAPGWSEMLISTFETLKL